MSQIAVYAYSLAAVLYALFGCYLFLAWRGARSGGMLLVAVGASTLWAVLNVWAATSATNSALMLALAGESLRSAAWLGFLVLLVRAVAPGKARLLGGLTALVVGLQMGGLSVAALGFEPSRLVALSGFLAAAVFALVLLEQLYRDVPVASRWGIKPLCLGLVAVHVFELYFFADGVLFARLDTDVWSVRGVVHAIAIPLIALSAARVPSWTLKITVSREVAFHSTALALSGIYLLVIAAVGYYVRYIGGDWGRAVQLALLFAALVVLGGLLLSGAQRARLKVLLNKHFFPYRYDYRKEWLRFTQALSASGDSADLGTTVIKALGDLVESSGGYLWLKGIQGSYVPHARLNQPAFDAVELEDSAFCRFLDEQEWIVDLEEVRATRSAPQGLALPDWLEGVPDAWLVVPLKGGAGLAGFVVLTTARAPFEVNWEVRDLLKTAARQAASYLARMQAAEALLEAGKFDSFNRMSAFVVHDLKNLVAQMALMLKNAERHRDNPEFQQDMIEMVAHVESRMRSLMSQLQEKTSIEPRRKIVLPLIVERVAESKLLQRPGIELQLHDGGDVTIDAHPEKLERVVGHIVQNALDACNGDGNVSARLVREGPERISLVIEDNGCGMTKEFIRDELFRPFRSSKRNGMGIGMYEAQQYVNELGGSIHVESEPGSGTRVTMLLPCRSGEPPGAL